jgi:hypothetical protein
MRLLLSFILIFCIVSVYAQKGLIPVKHSITGRLESNETKEQLKERLELQAQIEMIEKHFGKSISQSASTSIENESNGGQSKSKVNFNFQSNSIVRGEWVKYNEGYPKFKLSTKDEEVWYTVEISGFIREKAQLITFESFLTNCPKKSCSTEIFSNKEHFYMFFKSSTAGYIYTYFEDDYLEEVFLLLPSDPKIPEVKVEAGEEYIVFFDDDKSKLEKGIEILNREELYLELEPNRISDHYNLKVLFSEKKLSLPITKDQSHTIIENFDLADKTLFPESLDKRAFINFLDRLRVRNEDMQIMDLSITLEK